MLRRILRSESFRLTAAFVALFLAVIAVMAAALLWTVERIEREALLQAIDIDMQTVLNGFSAEGIREAIEVVHQRLGEEAGHRLHTRSAGFLLLQDRSGKVLAGNLPVFAPKIGAWEQAVPGSGSPGTHPRQMLGRGQLLPDGSYLYAGRDLAPVHALRGQILGALLWVALGGTILAIAAGTLFSVVFLRRIDAMARTCEAIVAGRLRDRIPLRGSGDELDRLSGTINRMLDRIAALLENLRQVSSDIAHDLRTPLTHLRQRLEIASNQAHSTEALQRTVDEAIHDTDELLGIFQALLRISQIESGQRAATFAPLDVSALLQRVMAIYGPLAEDESHVLRAQIATGLGTHGDAELLLQMCVNLVENALRHTPPGTRIVLGAAATATGVRIELADDGPGIPAEERDKVFRRFYRLDRDRSTPGNGLGLSLVAAVVRLHEGSIELAGNSPGLRVCIDLPGTPAHAHAAS